MSTEPGRERVTFAMARALVAKSEGIDVLRAGGDAGTAWVVLEDHGELVVNGGGVYLVDMLTGAISCPGSLDPRVWSMTPTEDP
jgi:hypothetical protein